MNLCCLCIDDARHIADRSCDYGGTVQSSPISEQGRSIEKESTRVTLGCSKTPLTMCRNHESSARRRTWHAWFETVGGVDLPLLCHVTRRQLPDPYLLQSPIRLRHGNQLILKLTNKPELGIFLCKKLPQGQDTARYKGQQGEHCSMLSPLDQHSLVGRH